MMMNGLTKIKKINMSNLLQGTLNFLLCLETYEPATVDLNFCNDGDSSVQL